MRVLAGAVVAVLTGLAAACSGEVGDENSEHADSGTPYVDAHAEDTQAEDAHADVSNTPDASSDTAPDTFAPDADTQCFVATDGVFGTCMPTSDCTALGDVSTPGYCPGPTDIECCTKAPDVADNPPVPAGWKLMQQAEVTPEMTSWAISILQDPTTYPMFSTTTQLFGTLDVMARVEWHPPDFNNNSVHRGVTLYEPG